jgi:hypothetical protein
LALTEEANLDASLFMKPGRISGFFPGFNFGTGHMPVVIVKKNPWTDRRCACLQLRSHNRPTQNHLQRRQCSPLRPGDRLAIGGWILTVYENLSKQLIFTDTDKKKGVFVYTKIA